MEEDGRQAKTSQSPNHSDNEGEKNQETVFLHGFSYRPMTLGDFFMKRYGIKDLGSESPYHSEKGSNVHNEGEKNQETLRLHSFSYRPMTLGDFFMKRYGIKDLGSESPYHSEKGSNVHNEENKNQEALRRWVSDWSRILEEHTMERNGIETSASQSPNHSYKASTAHNEWEKNQETLRLHGFSYRPMTLGDYFMKRYGIKDLGSESPYHSEKGSNVHNEGRKNQETLRRLIKPETSCTTPSIVKDESTVQNRDRADRSQMITYTPEVLDTHLSKEDVDSKVPQNNWRERIFSLRWKHLSVIQVIVVFLLMTSFTQGISSLCDTSRTMNCTQLFMTCSFDTDIIRLAKNLYMNHLQNNPMHLEIIVVCQMSSKGFHCETSPTYEFVSVESNRLTVKIPEVSKEHVGEYWCYVHGFADIDQKVCQLSVTDTSSEYCFRQVNGPSDKDDWLNPATIAVIVLSTLLVLFGICIIVILFKSSGCTKYIVNHFSFANWRSAPTTNTNEECEKL